MIKILLVFGLLSFFDVLCDSQCQTLSARKCNYNCQKCKNWRCMKSYCDKKREEK